MITDDWQALQTPKGCELKRLDSVDAVSGSGREVSEVVWAVSSSLVSLGCREKVELELG